MQNQLPTVSLFEVLKYRSVILKNPLDFHKIQYKLKGDSFIIHTGLSSQFIITRDAGFARHVLQENHRNYEKSTIQTKELARYIGKGLLTSNGKHWLTHRRMIQPGFSKKKLQVLFKIMNQAIVDELSSIKDAEMQNVFPLMSALAFQVVAKSLFSNGDIRNRMKKLQTITQTTQDMLIQELRQPWLKWWFTMNGSIKKHLNLANDARDIIFELIDERRKSGEDKDDLLDMLLAARYEDGTPMPDQQLIDEVLILFTAGHETTANALSFTLYHIARDEEIQQKIWEEASAFDFESDDLMQAYSMLPFTKSCLDEAMRLYPPAYMIDRVAIDDDQYDGLKIKKGTMILTSLFEIHRDGRYWTHGEEYNPDQFASEHSAESKGRYYPFGVGPRMCVGNHFAMFEMIVAIAQVVKRYKLSTNMVEVELDPLISLKPKEVPIHFTNRNPKI